MVTAERRFSRLRGCLPRAFVRIRFWAVGFYREFRKCGENRNLPRTLRFLPTKSQAARIQTRGLVDRSHFFTALPSSPVDNVRRPLEPPRASAFWHKAHRPPRGASGARLFWLNYSILDAHRAQFSMTIRTIFKWASTG